ncbi:MAG: hypothetical protein PUB19_01685 [Lachnospiraceae bacterium]|nr:hypothetical protein [Lachnospiraceae bacterium]
MFAVNNELHIGISEMNNRDYEVEFLLSKNEVEREAIGKRIVYQYNIESQTQYVYERVKALVKGEVIIQVQ